MLVHQLGHGDAIPDAPPSEFERNEDFLKSAHHILMEVHVCSLVLCSDCLFPFCIWFLLHPNAKEKIAIRAQDCIESTRISVVFEYHLQVIVYWLLP